MKFFKRLVYNLAAAAVVALLVLWSTRQGATPKRAADAIRVTTWNLQWFPNGSAKPAPAGKQVQNINAAAATLRALDPDVILLQEIRDKEACERLIEAMSPSKYEVLVCSQFREGNNAIGFQQVAILSKQSGDAAWAAAWKTKGLVDPPRGYAFAVIPFGKKQLGFYSLHLKSNLTRNNPEQENQLNILKRETAAEQLVEHAKSLEKDFPRLDGLVIGGDFNTNPDQALFESDKTLRILEENGFQNPFRGLGLKDRVTHPGKGKYPDATFDYLFHRGARAQGRPHIQKTPASDHYPVSLDLVP